MELGEDGLSRFFSLTKPFLDERQRRLLAAAMAAVLGRGGQARVAAAADISRNTMIAGAKELAEDPLLQARVRRPGAGPKRKVDLDPALLVVLDSLVEPESRGDPMSPLRCAAGDLDAGRAVVADHRRAGRGMAAAEEGSDGGRDADRDRSEGRRR